MNNLHFDYFYDVTPTRLASFTSFTDLHVVTCKSGTVIYLFLAPI